MTDTLVGAWNRTATANPRGRAFVDAASERIWTRGEIDKEADLWRSENGRGLANRSVVFAETNGASWLRLFLGLLKSEAVAIPIDPGEPPATQRALAGAIGAAFIWIDGRLELLSPRSRAKRDGRCLVKLTSGSTGLPRAIPFTDRQMLAEGRHICATMGIRAEDTNLGLIPFGHSYGLGNLVLPLVAQGTPIVGGLPLLPRAILAAAERWRPTVFPAVPALLRALADAPIERNPLKSLRTVISAGSALDPQIARTFRERFGIRIHNFYGSTETGGITYDRSGESTLSGRSVGAPLDGVRLKWDRGRRFLVESPAVFTLGNRRGSASLGAHRPADLGRLDETGELVLGGRTGRVLKIAGRRLDPSQVERALRRLTGVRDAFVAAHPRRPDAIAAVVAASERAGALQLALQSCLAPWKIPRKILVIPNFPVTARGKTDLGRLRELLEG